MTGKLLIIATPIGNLGDISPRIKQVLSECDFILVEDTRVSIKLLSHLGLRKRLISCHDHNEEQRSQLLEEAAAKGKTVALMSDAGTPLISDPGYLIVKKAISINMEVIPLPGPSAFTLALIGSGLPCDRFCFEGFLPDKPSAMEERLRLLKDEPRTLIFYISPHKLEKTLVLMASVFGRRAACLARELTKLHEEFIRDDLLALRDRISAQPVKGECVLVLEGASEEKVAASDEEVRQAVIAELKSGGRAKEVSQLLAQRLGRKKADIYRIAVQWQEEERGS